MKPLPVVPLLTGVPLLVGQAKAQALYEEDPAGSPWRFLEGWL